MFSQWVFHGTVGGRGCGTGRRPAPRPVSKNAPSLSTPTPVRNVCAERGGEGIIYSHVSFSTLSLQHVNSTLWEVDVSAPFLIIFTRFSLHVGPARWWYTRLFWGFIFCAFSQTMCKDTRRWVGGFIYDSLYTPRNVFTRLQTSCSFVSFYHMLHASHHPHL